MHCAGVFFGLPNDLERSLAGSSRLLGGLLPVARRWVRYELHPTLRTFSRFRRLNFWMHRA
jgi:hypothetical protein